jgi:hypothetical protein
MLTLEQAAHLLGVNPDVLTGFNVPDPFNGDQTIQGFLCHQGDHRYGALIIWEVAGQETEPQVIYCTPKLGYPFTTNDVGERRYRFPQTVDVECYPKLDGTNINCFSYADASGQRFVAYKTRLTPILRESTFGPFLSLWQEMLTTKEGLKEFIEGHVKDGKVTLSFELYGYRNQHLIQYPVALDTKMLFLVDQKDARVYPPSELQTFDRNKDAHLLHCEAVLTLGKDLVAFYEEKRNEAEAKNRKVLDGEDELIAGTEGYVFYVLDTDNVWHLLKCKPASVEDIHWASDSIPLSRILPTVWNSLESDPQPTIEGVKKLLLEEFTPAVVEKSIHRVEKAVSQVRERLAWRERVRHAYLSSGMTFGIHGRAGVMRALSGVFSKQEMKKVFTALREMGIVSKQDHPEA